MHGTGEAELAGAEVVELDFDVTATWDEAVRDVAAVAARVLTDDTHFGQAYTLTGPEALDHGQVAEIIGQAAGRDIRYEAISEDAMIRILDDEGGRYHHPVGNPPTAFAASVRPW